MTAFASQASVGGRFLIEREIGRGAVGIVYRAIDGMTNQPVALKVIAISGVDAGEEARFRREGRVLAGLVHPGIVRLVAFGQLDEEGLPYVAMEWLEGEDISQRMKRSPIPLVQCLDIAAQVADALAAAHAHGIVHRDVKPSNIFLVGKVGEDGPIVAKLVDFGVASAEDAKLTRTGAIIGTPAYMAPEQARGDEGVNARADLYALGATLFEMISGRPPHIGPTPIAILARLVTTPPPRLSDIFPDVLPALDDLMAELLATDPQERPKDAGTAADRLRGLAVGEAARAGGDTTREMRLGSDAPPISQVGPASQLSHSSGGSRLVTTILATHVPKGPPRTRLVAHLRARGAEATELGGDAVVAHLGVSRALGDEATRAIDLALRLAKVNATVGIATGRSRVERGTRPIGEVVDRAAALARDATRGQVLLDTTTAELAGGRYEFQIREDGSALVAGTHVHKKDALGGAPFVGREAELSQLVASFERCLDDRTPILATLTGAPGIGKTRLRREAIQRVSSHSSGSRVLLARCETFGKSHPLGV
ncbi:MAG TPA: protein kinase, partial [Polyangiaceae bacterium]